MTWRIKLACRNFKWFSHIFSVLLSNQTQTLITRATDKRNNSYEYNLTIFYCLVYILIYSRAKSSAHLTPKIIIWNISYVYYFTLFHWLLAITSSYLRIKAYRFCKDKKYTNYFHVHYIKALNFFLTILSGFRTKAHTDIIRTTLKK